MAAVHFYIAGVASLMPPRATKLCEKEAAQDMFADSGLTAWPTQCNFLFLSMFTLPSPYPPLPLFSFPLPTLRADLIASCIMFRYAVRESHGHVYISLNVQSLSIQLF